MSTNADDEPISLEPEHEASAAAPAPTAVRAFGQPGIRIGTEKVQFKRPLNVTGQGATRFRIFHSKIALTPLETMEQKINQWLESDNVEVKQVGHVIGVMEGKIAEPNLLVLVWY